jgi:integrase
MALLLLTGMRRGEVLGLRWDDIDFAKKTIYVRRNVTYPTNQPNITSTKTENGVRQIPLDDNLAILLDRPEHPRGFIVGGRHPITLMAYRWMYERIEKQVDLHEATAHIFRHSYLTMLDAAGVDPKTLQVIAGHGDIRITMNRYVHEREKDIEAAGVKLNSMMNVTLEPRPEQGKEQETSAA